MPKVELTEELLSDLVGVGNDKEAGTITSSWETIADSMNNKYNIKKTESWWRKLYKKNKNTVFETNEDEEISEKLRDAAEKLQYETMELREQRRAANAVMRNDYRRDSLLKIFEENIKAMPEIKPFEGYGTANKSEQTTVALLSDIHYGLTFNSFMGKYDSTIAQERLDKYANSVVDFAKLHGSSSVIVCILGDLISGLIHRTLLLENREDIVAQCTGVASCIARTLHYIARNIPRVVVHSVAGNHSRLDPNMEDCLRSERLDDLVIHMVKLHLKDCANIEWVKPIDSSVDCMIIQSHKFIMVHGDFDKKTDSGLTKLKDMAENFDYLLMGHMHVVSTSFDKTATIRNGCICGTGDDYSIKKRLFGPAMQVCFSVNANGVEDMRCIRL